MPVPSRNATWPVWLIFVSVEAKLPKTPPAGDTCPLRAIWMSEMPSLRKTPLSLLPALVSVALNETCPRLLSEYYRMCQTSRRRERWIHRCHYEQSIQASLARPLHCRTSWQIQTPARRAIAIPNALEFCDSLLHGCSSVNGWTKLRMAVPSCPAKLPNVSVFYGAFTTRRNGSFFEKSSECR